jgi:hypothetical protein
MWNGPDGGLIACWQRGREKAKIEPDLAKRAKTGVLVTLPWKGGTENTEDQDGNTKNKKFAKRFGTYKYLAMWQGLRGEDLNLDLDGERVIVCTKTKRVVVFRLKLTGSRASQRLT